MIGSAVLFLIHSWLAKKKVRSFAIGPPKAQPYWAPVASPSSKGNIAFPAPKNIEKMAIAIANIARISLTPLNLNENI